MYYKLNNHCTLIAGKARGAIYDLKSGKVYSISHKALELLTRLAEKPCETVFSKENTKVIAYLDKLSTLNLGKYFEEDPGITGFKIPTKPPISLEFLWLELTDNCNNRCLHCYSNSSPTSPSSNIFHEQWLNILEEAKKCGASAVQLIGGEPLLYKHWKDLIIKAHALKYSYIEIFTNATLLTDEDIAFIKKYGVLIATTIFADNKDVHDRVTQTPGSFDKTITAIQKILKNKIPLRIASIIMKANEDQVENIIKLQEKLGVEVSPPDVVRPTGRGENKHIISEKYVRPPITPPFYCSEEFYIFSHFYNTCFAGKLAVTAQGDVIPCIFARNLVCGNINSDSLQNIIDTKLMEYWCLTKDKLDKCNSCEFRYACSDCRALAASFNIDKDIFAPTFGCGYNPSTGQWTTQ